MTVRETADYLTERGYRCGVATVRALCRVDPATGKARLRSYRVGVGRGRIEVPESEANAFLKSAIQGSGAGATTPRTRAPRPKPRPAPVAVVVAGGDDGAWRERLQREREA